MLKNLRKLKSGVRYYAANYKNDKDSNIVAKELQLVTQIFLLLDPLFFATKECTGLPQGQKIKKSQKKLRKMTKSGKVS